MNIIQAHKYYWHRDGASNYMIQLGEMLESAGHKVIPFAVQQEKTISSEYSKYFVEEMELSDPSKVSFARKLKSVANIFYSVEAKHKLEQLFHDSDIQIDIVHLHNIYHHISPSILPVIKKRGIPIVMTLHDYKLLTPNYTMFHHGAVHEEDAKGWYLNCVKNKCLKDSRAQSAIVTAEMIFHHKIMKYYERYVDLFISPSQFLMDKCLDFGWPKEKFVAIPHPIDDKEQVTRNKPVHRRSGEQFIDGDCITYIGRLSEEKGVDVLIQAAALTPDIPYRIVGTGPMEKRLQAIIKDNSLTNVTLCGFKSGKELDEERTRARVLVVPSIWYENYPLSILEPKTAGKVVIGAKIGGIPELLPEELLVESGNIQALAQAITTWYTAPSDQRKKMGERLQREVQVVNDPEKHLRAIEEIYATLKSR